MYKTLLVPFDGSAHSARALPLASALARRTGAALQVVLVHDPSAYIPFVPGEVAIPVYDQELVHEQRARDQAALDAAVARLTQEGIAASGVLLEGTVVEALEERVESSGADLVIMTTHGRSGFERLRMGSVTTAFLARSTTPVLLVHGAEQDTPTSLPTGTLLCPLDGSPFSESILPHARRFAEATGMTMHLVAVAVPQSVPLAPFGAEALLADDSFAHDEEAARADYLQRVAGSCPPGTTVGAVTDMSVGRALLDLAASAGAIAMATHGRGGIKRLVLGSVADEVVRHTHIPVLVYRPSA
jgi:nucleotide-binding universal stress UspA family protein